MRRTPLSIFEILKWADAFQRKTGRWPTIASGAIRERPDDTWRRIDSALRLGLRGLRGGSSLARLLAEARGARNTSCLPHLTIQQILSWADSHYRRTRRWPTSESGRVVDHLEETWKRVDNALRLGLRGLPGDSSLAQLLARRRGVRNIQSLPRLTVKQILIWADAHYRRIGEWPNSKTGRIAQAPGETWSGIKAALQSGRRGFPGGDSLARLLARERGTRNPKQPPELDVDEILRWVASYRRRTGQYPSRQSGPISEAPGETWAMIDRALRKGKRGLRVQLSLYHLLRDRGLLTDGADGDGKAPIGRRQRV
jgi:hypothetical protein